MFTSTGTENDEEDDEEDEGDYEEEEEEEEDILENMNPKIRQSLQNLANTGLENCAVTEKPEAVDDFFSLDITGIIGNKLLESVEHMTYSIRKVVSGAQYGQNSLAQQIQKKCQTVLRRQQAIKNELAELKITLQQFKCGSSIRHS